MVIIKKIIISGYYGFNNLGDEAILAAWVQGLKKYSNAEAIKIIALSNQPQETAKKHGIEAIGRYDILALVKNLLSADLLISGGGGLLQDVTGKFSVAYYLSLIVLAKILGCKTFFAAQGVGPIKTKFNRFLIAKVLEQVDKISVRDKQSKELLAEFGVKQKIILTADLALSLASGSKESGVQLLQEEGITVSESMLAVVIRDWQENEYLAQLAKVLNDLASKYNFKLLIIPFKLPGDLKVSYKFKELLNPPAQLLKKRYSPLEMIDLIKVFDFLIGVRLHSLIFASLNRVPVAGIAYDPKINNFLARLEIEPVAEIDSLTVANTSKKISDLWEEKESFLATKEKKIADLAGLSGHNLEIALKLVGINE